VQQSKAFGIASGPETKKVSLPFVFAITKRKSSGFGKDYCIGVDLFNPKEEIKDQ
jgi:hypothetical protein